MNAISTSLVILEKNLQSSLDGAIIFCCKTDMEVPVKKFRYRSPTKGIRELNVSHETQAPLSELIRKVGPLVIVRPVLHYAYKVSPKKYCFSMLVGLAPWLEVEPVLKTDIDFSYVYSGSVWTLDNIILGGDGESPEFDEPSTPASASPKAIKPTDSFEETVRKFNASGILG